MTPNQHILSLLREQQAELTSLLTQLVEHESPTDDKPSLDRLAAFLAEQARALGAQVEILPQSAAGDFVRARWNADAATAASCSCATWIRSGIWARLAQRPVRIADGKLYGPGAFDMKGGIVVALGAIRALSELGLMPSRRITLLITSDEETGSDASRALIEAEALAHEAVFVLEPAHPPRGSLKTWRKGVGMYTVTVTGRSAHAGAAHDQGINAIAELAHHILAFEALTDYAAGTTVNVGVIGGGTRSNVVPEHAWAEVDVRVMNAEEAARIDAAFRGAKPHLPGATVEVAGGLNRPPMVRSAADHGALRPRRSHRGRAGHPHLRDRHRRRVGWQFHGRAGRADAGRPGRDGRRRPRAARARDPLIAAGARRAAGVARG